MSPQGQAYYSVLPTRLIHKESTHKISGNRYDNSQNMQKSNNQYKITELTTSMTPKLNNKMTDMQMNNEKDR